MFEFSSAAGLWGLAASSFVSATLLPGASEWLLVAVIHEHPADFWPAIGVATACNTAGAMTSYCIGRVVPNRADPGGVERVRRYGYPVLLLAWLPVVGDALPLAAGWLRFKPLASTVLIAAGKFARYLVIAGAWRWFTAA